MTLCILVMGTNVPERHTASILRDEVGKSGKVAGDTKGRRKEMGNGGDHKKERERRGRSQTDTWEQCAM